MPYLTQFVSSTTAAKWNVTPSTHSTAPPLLDTTPHTSPIPLASHSHTVLEPPKCTWSIWLSPLEVEESISCVLIDSPSFVALSDRAPLQAVPTYALISRVNNEAAAIGRSAMSFRARGLIFSGVSLMFFVVSRLFAGAISLSILIVLEGPIFHASKIQPSDGRILFHSIFLRQVGWSFRYWILGPEY